MAHCVEPLETEQEGAMPEFIQVEQRGRITILSLNRPDKLNAINSAMREELIEALEVFNADDRQEAVVIMGAGEKAFSAGQDLAEAVDFTAESVAGQTDLARRLFHAVISLDKPSVAALNGIAVGAGFQLALLADLRVGHAETRMGQPEIRVGLPSVIGTRIMSLFLGHAQTMELSLTGRILDAEEAESLGLINMLVPAEEVLEKAIALAEALADQPKLAMRLTKEAAREVVGPLLDRAIETGHRMQEQAYASGEPRAVMQDFLDKRKRP